MAYVDLAFREITGDSTAYKVTGLERVIEDLDDECAQGESREQK